MSLIDVNVNIRERRPPNDVAEFLEEADLRIKAFVEERKIRISGFVPSDFEPVFHALEAVVENDLAAGDVFCEWGSGFGIVTMMAALHDFTSFGIEVESELVDRARTLAGDLDIPVEFSQGSFIPPGGHRLIQYQEDVAHIETDTPSGYEEFDLEIADFDLFFAFPWPGEILLKQPWLVQTEQLEE